MSAAFEGPRPPIPRLLMEMGRRHGPFAEVELRQVATRNGHEGEFLVLVRIVDGITVCSEPMRWSDVGPAVQLAEAETVEHILRRLEEIVDGLKSEFYSYAWIRVAAELAEVRRIIDE